MDEIAGDEIFVYGKNDCVKCESTVELLDELELKYTYINMDKTPEAKATVKGLGFRQAPVVMTKKGNWSGHEEAKIRSLKGRDLSMDDDIWG